MPGWGKIHTARKYSQFTASRKDGNSLKSSWHDPCSQVFHLAVKTGNHVPAIHQGKGSQITFGEMKAVSTTTAVAEREQPSPEVTPQGVAIEFRNVSVGFDDREVLRDVSFTLRR